MKVKVLCQGLNPDIKNSAGFYIINSLKSENYNSMKAFVAFVRQSGIIEIIEELEKFNKTNDLVLYVGVDLNGTSEEALRLLLEKEIKTYIVYSPNTITYHPKVYFFEGENKTRIITGSSNLTNGGLFNNIESSLCIDLKNKKINDMNVIKDFYDTFDSLISLKHTSCQLLTEDLLTLLLSSKLVLSEKKISKNIAIQKKKLNKEVIGEEPFNNIKTLFKNIKSTNKARNLENITKTLNESDKPNVDTELNNGWNKMWHETGALTGGSGNILDISMSGHINTEIKEGAGTFFNIDDKNKIHNLTIEFNGKEYFNNTLKYAPDNGSWRLQLKGKTSINERFTDYTRNGQLKYKILLFTKKSELNYKLEILKQSELDNLKSQSDWAYGGKSGNNKLYGFTY